MIKTKKKNSEPNKQTKTLKKTTRKPKAKKETKPKTQKTNRKVKPEHRLGLIAPDGYEYPESNKYIVFDIETTGLLPWEQDKITCICAKTSDGTTFSKSLKKQVMKADDGLLIKDFMDFLDKYPASKGYKLITQYGKGFDIPFILSRLAQQTDHFFDTTLKKIKGYKHLDLKDIDRSSLKDKAERLNIGITKNGNGKSAIELAKKGKWRELKDYCMQDVEVTERVYIKLKHIINN